jgi:hypothetical protein
MSVRGSSFPQPPDVLLCLLIRQYLVGHATSEEEGPVRQDLTKLANFLSTCLLHDSAGPRQVQQALAGRSAAPTLATAAIEALQGSVQGPRSFPWLAHPSALRDQLFRVLSPLSASQVYVSVQSQLAALTSPNAVADLFGELKSLVHGHIERDSTCGRYLRRQVLDFERQMFAGVSHLFNRLQRMLQEPPPSAPAPAPAPARALAPAGGSGTPSTTSNDSVSFSDAAEGLHRTLDLSLRLGVTYTHASLHLGALHLSQGQYQSAVTGESAA